MQHKSEKRIQLETQCEAMGVDLTDPMSHFFIKIIAAQEKEIITLKLEGRQKKENKETEAHSQQWALGTAH